jgi:hypothetical protein
MLVTQTPLMLMILTQGAYYLDNKSKVNQVAVTDFSENGLK